MEWQRLEARVLSGLFLGLLTVVLGRLVFVGFGVPVPDAAEELIRAGSLWMIMLSASLASAQWTAATGTDPLCRMRQCWRAAIFFAAAVVSLMLMSAALRYLLFDLHLGSRPLLGMSRGWLILPIPLLFLVIALRFLRAALGKAATGQ